MANARAALKNFVPATSRNARSRHTLLLQMAKEAEELAAQGRRIAELRAAKARREGQRITQPMVAEAVGVGLRGYQLWEAGHGDIDPRNLKALADFLETSPDYIEYGVERFDRSPTPDLSNGNRNATPEGNAAAIAELNARLNSIADLLAAMKIETEARDLEVLRLLGAEPPQESESQPRRQ